MKAAENFLYRVRNPGEQSLKPIQLASGIVSYANVRENTQCSVYMQRDIETQTQQMKIGIGLNLSLPYVQNVRRTFDESNYV